MTYAPKLKSSFIKVIWAQKSIEQLNHGLAAAIENHRRSCEIQIDPETGDGICTIAPMELDIGVYCITADIIHSLRSALDCAVSQLDFEATGAWSSRVHFPFHETEAEMRRSFEPKGGNFGIADKFPALRDAILDDFKTWKHGDFDLWALNKADNISKHRQITAAATVVVSDDLQFQSEREIFAGNQFVIMPGSPPFIIRIPQDAAIKKQPTTTVNVIFGPETLFSGRPLIPVLIKLALIIDKIICKIEIEFGNAAWGRERIKALK